MSRLFEYKNVFLRAIRLEQCKVPNFDKMLGELRNHKDTAPIYTVEDCLTGRRLWNIMQTSLSTIIIIHATKITTQKPLPRVGQ